MQARRTRHVGSLGLALLLVVFIGPVLADDPTQTAGFMNGRGWKPLSSEMKTAYLWGLSEGSEFIKNNTNLFPKRLSFQEAAAALDEFFRDPTNAIIPVPIAVTYVRRKVEGASRAELSDLESKMRREAESLVH